MKTKISLKSEAARKQWKSSKNLYELHDLPAAANDLGNFSQLARHLLALRGIKNAEEAENFLRPNYDKQNHDPFLLKGMEEGVARILEAMEKKERIMIYTDYDADGIPGGVVLHDLFKKIGYANFTNYIPHRHNEGFGLNLEAVEKFAKDDVKLIITVDCGITDVLEVKRASELGMEVIITDHHLPAAELPAALAIIDPKQEGCEYPFKELCGSGVAFKLAQAVIAKDRQTKNKFNIISGAEKWFLDMVGLATLSDMVPLVGENRVFAFYGLKVLRKTPRLGLLQLARQLRLDLNHLTEDDIGFTITPRINAASRMGQPRDAFDLLKSTDVLEAGRLALHLDEINTERKTAVAVIVREANKMCSERTGNSSMKPLLVLGNPDWRPSLLGLVASKLVEEHKRPVFLWGREAGEGLKGSCRSDGSANVVELMERSKHVLLGFGGHRMAGGFSTSIDLIHRLDEELNNSYNEFRGELTRQEVCGIDQVLSLDDVTWENYREIEKLAPFGLGNPKPVFMFEKIEIDNVRSFGKGNLHLELAFLNSKMQKISAIAFFTKPNAFGSELNEGAKINLVAHMEKSVFRGNVELRLRIMDLVA